MDMRSVEVCWLVRPLSATTWFGVVRICTFFYPDVTSTVVDCCVVDSCFVTNHIQNTLPIHCRRDCWRWIWCIPPLVDETARHVQNRRLTYRFSGMCCLRGADAPPHVIDGVQIDRICARKVVGMWCCLGVDWFRWVVAAVGSSPWRCE